MDLLGSLDACAVFPVERPVVHCSYAFARMPRMKTAPAAGVNPAALDFRKSLLESFALDEKFNHLAWQVCHGIPAKAGLAVREWGTLWRESVSGK
jgi:hypothetical protein